MAIPPVPDALIWNALSAILHKNDADPLSSDYVEIVAEANRLAIADLNRILTIRGFGAAQIASWDDAGRYCLDQAIYWALMRAPGLGDYSDKFAKTFDRRKELMDAPAIMIGGIAVQPSPDPGSGGVSHGRLGAYDAGLRNPNIGGVFGRQWGSW